MASDASLDPPHMIESIDHINIVVDDLDAMVAFYTKVLGLKITKEVVINGEWVGRVVGLSNVEADVVYLEFRSGGPRIELIRYRTPNGLRPVGIDVANAKGLRHLAFRVRDIDSTVAALKASGVELWSDVEVVPDDQVRYKNGLRKRLLYFRDPEKNLLELCEYRS